MSIKHFLRNVVIKTVIKLYGFSSPQPIVLLYHSINTGGHWLSMSPDLFEKQIKFFKDNGFNFLSLDDLDSLDKVLNSKSVLITFDDGFQDNYIFALPILKKYNVPAVFFIATNYVGVFNEKQEFLCMDWGQIREIADHQLFTIGAHSLSHKKLDELSDEEAKKEIFESKKIIEEKIGRPIYSFAFPYGRYANRLLKILQAAGFKYNFTTTRKRITTDVDLFEIPRYVVDLQSQCFVKYMPYRGYEFYWRLYRKIFNRI